MHLFLAMWTGFFVYWAVMARRVKESARLEPAGSRRLRLGLMLVATVLLAMPGGRLGILDARFLPDREEWYWVGVAMTAAGMLFSIWARWQLGSNWSQAVTVKKDHELITSGPYGFVRHPIYTGLLLALLGSAVAGGEWRGLAGVALLGYALWKKLKLEEEWMRGEFGERYEAYAKRVAALVPYVL